MQGRQEKTPKNTILFVHFNKENHMSVVIQNQNRSIVSSVVTPATLNAAVVYVTIPNMPVCCEVESVRVTSSSNLAAWQINLLDDAAQYRSDSSSTHIVAQMSTPSGWTSAPYINANFGGVYYKDATETGKLHLSIGTGGANFTNGVTFTVTVTVTPKFFMPDALPFSSDRSFRVLRKTAAATTAFDLTQAALRNGNPYKQGNADQSERFILFGAATDIIYIGCETKLAGVMATIPLAQNYLNSIRLDYSTGNDTWTTLSTFYDNTSDGQAAPNSLYYSGTLKFGTISGWIKGTIATDPLKAQGATIDSSKNATVPAFFYNPPLYWIRLRPASGATISTPINLVGLQPLRI